MPFGFLSRMTTYLKSTERGVMKLTKDTFINISSDRTLLIVTKNAPINLK